MKKQSEDGETIIKNKLKIAEKLRFNVINSKGKNVLIEKGLGYFDEGLKLEIHKMCIYLFKNENKFGKPENFEAVKLREEQLQELVNLAPLEEKNDEI